MGVYQLGLTLLSSQAEEEICLGIDLNTFRMRVYLTVAYIAMSLITSTYR